MYDAMYEEDFLSEPECEEEQKHWKIEDDRAADWALQKIAYAKKEYARVEALGLQQIAEVEAKLSTAKAKCDKEIERLTGHLAEYFETVEPRISKGKTKATYKLLNGSLVKKMYKPEPKYDEKELLTWLIAHNRTDMIKVTTKPAWEAFKRTIAIAGDKVVIKDTGEIVDGVSVSISPDKFVVETE